MKLSDLQSRCDDAGLDLVERSEHHVQVCLHDQPLVDVWPSTNKFLEHRAPAGKRARVGNVDSVILAAKQKSGALSHRGNGRAPEPAADPLQPLIDLFRGDESRAGGHGDDHGLSPAQTAVWLIGELRKRERKATDPQPQDFTRQRHYTEAATALLQRADARLDDADAPTRLVRTDVQAALRILSDL